MRKFWIPAAALMILMSSPGMAAAAEVTEEAGAVLDIHAGAEAGWEGVSSQTIVGVTCEEQDFSAVCPAECTTLFEEGSGLYVYLGDYGTIPYVLIFKRDGNDDDIEGFLKGDAHQSMVSRYGDDLLSAEYYGTVSFDGHEMPGACWRYRLDGKVVHMLRVMENRDGYCVSFIMKYFEDDTGSAEKIGSVLNTLVGSLQPDAHYYDNAFVVRGDGTGDPAPDPGPESAGSEVYSMKLSDIREGENAFGQCAVPEGYEISWEMRPWNMNRSVSDPCQLVISARGQNGAVMTYYSASGYGWEVGTGEDHDGEMGDTGYVILHYMTPLEYCDYWMLGAHPDAVNIYVADENDFPGMNDVLSRKDAEGLEEAKKEAEIYGGLMELSSMGTKIYARSYTYEVNGTEYYSCAVVLIGGIQMTVPRYTPLGIETVSTIVWEMPFLFVMDCPASAVEDAWGAFVVFVENTSASDQFLNANREMSAALWEAIKKSRKVETGTTFSEQKIREATSSGEDYDEERFTDYIFDQNDYTLSDGSHVKVPTDYEYVYEGDGNTVYYSDSAFAEPGGSTRLYPN